MNKPNLRRDLAEAKTALNKAKEEFNPLLAEYKRKASASSNLQGAINKAKKNVERTKGREATVTQTMSELKKTHKLITKQKANLANLKSKKVKLRMRESVQKDIAEQKRILNTQEKQRAKIKEKGTLTYKFFHKAKSQSTTRPRKRQPKNKFDRQPITDKERQRAERLYKEALHDSQFQHYGKIVRVQIEDAINYAKKTAYGAVEKPDFSKTTLLAHSKSGPIRIEHEYLHKQGDYLLEGVALKQGKQTGKQTEGQYYTLKPITHEEHLAKMKKDVGINRADDILIEAERDGIINYYSLKKVETPDMTKGVFQEEIPMSLPDTDLPYKFSIRISKTDKPVDFKLSQPESLGYSERSTFSSKTSSKSKNKKKKDKEENQKDTGAPDDLIQRKESSDDLRKTPETGKAPRPVLKIDESSEEAMNRVKRMDQVIKDRYGKPPKGESRSPINRKDAGLKATGAALSGIIRLENVREPVRPTITPTQPQTIPTQPKELQIKDNLPSPANIATATPPKIITQPPQIITPARQVINPQPEVPPTNVGSRLLPVQDTENIDDVDKIGEFIKDRYRGGTRPDENVKDKQGIGGVLLPGETLGEATTPQEDTILRTDEWMRGLIRDRYRPPPPGPPREKPRIVPKTLPRIGIRLGISAIIRSKQRQDTVVDPPQIIPARVKEEPTSKPRNLLKPLPVQRSLRSERLKRQSKFKKNFIGNVPITSLVGIINRKEITYGDKRVKQIKSDEIKMRRRGRLTESPEPRGFHRTSAPKTPKKSSKKARKKSNDDDGVLSAWDSRRYYGRTRDQEYLRVSVL